MSVVILFKVFIVIVFIMIALSLASGLFFLVKDDSESNRLVTSLTFRVALSIILFVSLFVGYKFGWIQPHGLGQ